MNNTRSSHLLCRFDELTDGEARGFTIDGTPAQDIFIVRHQGRVHAYRNRCPHTGAPLDWLPDQFLNAENTLIQCATHAALFRIDDGLCIAGPCVGARLTALPVTVKRGAIVITDTAVPI